MSNKPKPQPAPSLVETIFAQAAAIEIQQLAKVGRKIPPGLMESLAELAREAAVAFQEAKA